MKNLRRSVFALAVTICLSLGVISPAAATQWYPANQTFYGPFTCSSSRWWFDAYANFSFYLGNEIDVQAAGSSGYISATYNAGLHYFVTPYHSASYRVIAGSDATHGHTCDS